MTLEEPRSITVELYPEQIDQLEHAANTNPDVDSVNELVRLLVAENTDTLDSLRPPGAPEREKIRRLLEGQQGLLEDVREEIDGEGDADLDEVRHLLTDVRNHQEKISAELEQRTIY